jgi:dTMP kinase
MAQKKGKFIVIDGSDGSGKATQSEILIKKLQSLGHEVVSFDFPQYDKTFFGQMVGQYLNGKFGDMSEIDPRLISLLYAGDRWQASAQIKGAILAGKIVVSNRYIQSNMAFSGARFENEAERLEFMKWLEKLEYETYSIPRADVVLYLHVPYEIGQKLVDKKAKRSYTDKKRDIHEKNSDYLKEVEKTYLWLSERYPEWQKIECAKSEKILSIDQISDMVFDIIKKKLEIK